MGWDATLEYPGPIDSEFSATVITQDCTHNLGGMLFEAIKASGDQDFIDLMGEDSWYRVLDGLNANLGAAFLDATIVQLEKDPEKYRAMNPSNGWDNYDELVPILKRMRQASQEHPNARWRSHG
jgi:hypothetical protein